MHALSCAYRCVAQPRRQLLHLDSARCLEKLWQVGVLGRVEAVERTRHDRTQWPSRHSAWCRQTCDALVMLCHQQGMWELVGRSAGVAKERDMGIGAACSALCAAVSPAGHVGVGRCADYKVLPRSVTWG